MIPRRKPRPNALGAALKTQVDTDGHRIGPVVRWRHGLDDSFGVDVGAGVYLVGREHRTNYRHPMPMADVGVS